MIPNLFFGFPSYAFVFSFVGRAKLSSMNIKEKTIPPKTLSTNFNLKSFMITLIFLNLIIAQKSPLLAKEPTLAILKDVHTNGRQKYGIKNYTFECTPYGVVSLEKLYSASPEKSQCRKDIVSFYKKNPNLQNYSLQELHTMQTYHIEFRQENCIVYSHGQVTLSEMLVLNGLALVKLVFEDDEFRFAFLRAQMSAKEKQKGLWKETIYESCLGVLEQ